MWLDGSLWQHCRELRTALDASPARPSARGRAATGSASCLCNGLALSGVGGPSVNLLQVEDVICMVLSTQRSQWLQVLLTCCERVRVFGYWSARCSKALSSWCCASCSYGLRQQLKR
jgi:hypothetical protein